MQQQGLFLRVQRARKMDFGYLDDQTVERDTVAQCETRIVFDDTAVLVEQGMPHAVEHAFIQRSRVLCHETRPWLRIRRMARVYRSVNFAASLLQGTQRFDE